jgi:hypothetical protein
MIVDFNGLQKKLVDPNICPHCHVINNPHHKWIIQTNDTDNIDCYLSAWLCSNEKCNKVFIVQYKLSGENFVFTRNLSGLPNEPNWPKAIVQLKSRKIDKEGGEVQTKFIKIYRQSLEAENYGLDELARMGYRKAIECLVKDWATQNMPEEKEIIQISRLGGVIKGYYDAELTEVLESATWIGKDYARYNRLFKKLNVKIIKEIIELIVEIFEQEYNNARYLK